jgi:hypothetical protein
VQRPSLGVRAGECVNSDRALAQWSVGKHQPFITLGQPFINVGATSSR